MPPQTNAKLLKVAGVAVTGGESYDAPSAAGADKWAGDVDVYIRDRRNSRKSGDGEDIVLERTVIVDGGDPPVDWRVGDTITVQRTGDAAPSTAKVEVVDRSAIDDPDIPPDLKTFRLHLTPA